MLPYSFFGSAKVPLVFIIKMNNFEARFKMGIEIKIKMRLRKRITGRIQFDMLTVCQTKTADFIIINRISVELCFHVISILMAMFLI